MSPEAVDASGHGHWRKYGILNEGAYFAALQNELSGEQADSSVLTECLSEIRHFAYHRAKQAVKRFVNEMRGVDEDDHDLHADSIAAAKLMWDSPMSTAYMESIQTSSEVLAYENSVLRSTAVAIDPRVGPNKRPLESLVFQAFRDGRNIATKEAASDPANSNIVELMTGGRPSTTFDPPKTTPLPHGMHLGRDGMAILQDLRDNLWYGDFNQERACALAKMLVASAEDSGARWAERFLAAAGSDTQEKLENRKRLLREAWSAVSSYVTTFRPQTRAIYSEVPMSRAAEKMMGVGSDLLGGRYGNNYHPLEALLHDAAIRGIVKTVKLAEARKKNTAGLDFLRERYVENEAPLLSQETADRMTGASSSGKMPERAGVSWTPEDLISEVRSTPASKKKWFHDLEDAGDYYRLIALRLQPARRDLYMKKSLDAVIIRVASTDTVEVRFEDQRGRGVAPASLLIPGPKRTGKTYATLDDVVVSSVFFENVRLGTTKGFIRHFKEDPLTPTYRENGMSPIDFMMHRNMTSPLVNDAIIKKSTENSSMILADAWTYLMARPEADAIKGKALTTPKDEDFLKIEIEGRAAIMVFAKPNNVWQINDGGKIVQGTDVKSLIAALDDHIAIGQAFRPS
jgi:hypothetical protein